jgi:hypothetical protein
LQKGTADPFEIKVIDQMLQGRSVLELVADTVDQFTVFFAAVIAFIKALPTSTDRIGTDYKRGVVMKGDFHE